ncbi:pilus assembly protein TadG-related protein [Streptomyces sp. NBC_00523]|uniref:pilus assembly protein TadG-related protein n=1 Tax=Streptomyces sp. NBC_00523 TaxID=2975765 RepID=UPI002E808D32|nr:pilus assembly protein TadG-related protein [Streptomyces sp. NBC_00523]WUD02067.1 pilus assembly protein TadG-related protein [Streptomyces sp. NBC_00523]
MKRGGCEESGQAAPLYIAAVAGLLFLALVLFAFGEADVQRNGAQSAADAAALAAAKESRSSLEPDLMAHLTDPDYFEAVFNARYLGVPGDACWKASEFAALNKAGSVRCRQLSGRWGYVVRVRSGKGVSTDIVPGVKGEKAEAEAVAVVEPRCSFTQEPENTPVPGSSPDEDTGTDEDPDPGATAAPVGKVSCDGGEEWVVDPEDLALMPDIADLFSVHLAEN